MRIYDEDSANEVKAEERVYYSQVNQTIKRILRITDNKRKQAVVSLKL